MVKNNVNINGSELPLDVPQAKEIRHNIRRAVDSWFLHENMMPPVSYDTLSNLSTRLIEKNNWEPGFKAFVMVCCGNAIWRQVVKAVPYNRRIFLLPQCLKNSTLCQGQQDELGLLCSECGNCSISGYLREAENLGYVAIVTEGTTITARLIESGKVDAVIGVGCMDVLQKMFASVSKYSIPSIGIPLLTNGCTDTLADMEWIKEELYQFDNSITFRLHNLNYLRNRTSSLFGEEQLSRILKLDDTTTGKIVRESLLAGGKRLRPLLTVLAYDAFSSQTDTYDLNRLALSVECFHKASLIHDDIEDDDDTRYGKETLHARYGVPIAINIGDLLIGEGYRLLTECNLPPDALRDCLKIVSLGHRALSIGQGTELIALKNHQCLSLKDILQVFENKTAAAFKVSLLLGARAAGADSISLEMLEQFSTLIGVAYQINDDLEDFVNHKKEFTFEKPSVVLSMLNDKLDDQNKPVFEEAYVTGNLDTIQMLIETYKIQERVEALLRDYISQSNACLSNYKNMGLKLALHEILGKTFKEYI
jgi:geranylgeranyl diphosphate synthase, type II